MKLGLLEFKEVLDKRFPTLGILIGEFKSRPFDGAPPYFVLANGKLQQEGTPIEEAPPEETTLEYLLSVLQKRVEEQGAKFIFLRRGYEEETLENGIQYSSTRLMLCKTINCA